MYRALLSHVRPHSQNPDSDPSGMAFPDNSHAYHYYEFL